MGNAESHPTHLKLKMVDNKRIAERLLQDAEAIDFYLDTCRHDPMNAKARRKLNYAINSLSSKEYEYYQSALDKIVKQLPKRLQMDLQEVSILSLMPSADGGMPHTRPYQLICFPHIEQVKTSLSTMIHELWHVHQRKYKETWTRVFEQLGWSEWSGRLPAFLEKNRRLNPDTIDSPLWVYQNTWVPVPVFRDISLPSVGEVDIWFYHVNEEYHLKQIPSKMEVFFPNLPQSAYEHPREITAYLLADHSLYTDSPAMKSLLSSVGQLAIS
jgi:hypothetical protein